MEKTITWNTGRLYTAEGQVITARFDFTTGRVIFRDHSRAIAGVLRNELPQYLTINRADRDAGLQAFVDREYLHMRYDYDPLAQELQRGKDRSAANALTARRSARAKFAAAAKAARVETAPVTILAVHLMATKRKTLCKLPFKPFPEQQSVPVAIWDAVKPEYRCPVCEREWRLQCTLESLTGGEA